MKVRRLRLIALMATLGTATIAAPAATAHAESVSTHEIDIPAPDQPDDGDEEEEPGVEMSTDYGIISLQTTFKGTQDELDSAYQALSADDAEYLMGELNLSKDKYAQGYSNTEQSLIAKMENTTITLNDTDSGKSVYLAFFDPAAGGYDLVVLNADNPSMELGTLPSYIVVMYDVAPEKVDYSKIQAIEDYLTDDRMQKFNNEDQMKIYTVLSEIDWDLAADKQDVVDEYAKALQDVVDEALSHRADYSFIDAMIAHVDYSDMSEETAADLKAYLDGLDRTVCNEDYMAVMEYEVRFHIGNAYEVGVLANYKELFKVLDTIPDDLDYKYTAASRDAVKEYLNKISYKLADWEQDEVDSLCGELNDAINRLVKLPEGITLGDYTRLNELKSIFESLDPNDYTSISYEQLKNYMDAINWELTSDNQSQIDSYVMDVEKLMEQLVKVTDADFSELDSVLSTVPGDLEHYTKTSRQELEDALSNVDSIYQLRSDEQETINAYVEGLKNLINALTLRVDSFELEELLKKIPTNYKDIMSEDKIEEIDYVLSSVWDYEDVTDEATMQDYIDIVRNCVEKISYGDYSKVDAMIESIPDDLSMYSDESVLELQDYISKIDRSLLPEEQDKIDAYVDGIKTRLNALEYRKADFTLVDQALENVPQHYLDWFDNNEELLQVLLSIDRNLDITHQEEVNALADKINAAIAKLVLKQADYSSIEEALAMVPEDLSGYSADSVFRLKDLLDSITYGLTIDYQDQVDEKAQEIKDAIAALTVEKGNYDALNAVIEDIPENLNLYKNGDQIKKILDEIDYGLGANEQATIDEWTRMLTEEISKLEYKDGDYTGVDDALTMVPKDMEQWYTKESIQKVYDAINSVIRGLNITHQNEIDAMTIAISDSISQLVYLPADYTELNNTIASIPLDYADIYTEESVNALKEILSQIEDGLNIKQQQTVNGWNESLKKAIENLKMKGADYSAIKELLGKVPEDYEKYYDGADALKAAIENVEYNKNINEQDAVDRMAAELKQALDGLVVKKADYSAWNKLLAEVPKDLSVYKNGTEIEQLIDAMDYDLDIFFQDNVDASTSALSKLLKELSYKDADYTELDKVLATVPEDLSIYTNADHLKELLQNVSYDKNITQQDEIDTLTENIRSEIEKLVLKAADYSDLQKVIATIPENYEMWYTESTASAVKNILASINWDLDITKQNAVDDYAEKLADAIKLLQYKQADYTELESAIASVPKDLSIYKDTSALKDALDKVTYDLDITHQNEVDAMAAAIKKAVSELELKDADYGMIKDMIASLPENMDEIYTSESVKAVMEIINSIPENLDILSQEIVNEYAQRLDNAIRALVYKDADYSALDAILSTVPDDLSFYDNTDDLYKALDGIVRGKNITQQDEVDAMTETVKAALAKISLKAADYSKLDEVLAKVPKDLSVYKDTSVVEKLLEQVDRTLSVKEQDQVDALTEKIVDAIGKLEYKDADYSKLDEALTLVPKDLSNYDNTEALTKAMDAIERDLNITQQEKVDAMAAAVKDALSKISLKSADYTNLDRVISSIPTNLSLYKDTFGIEEMLKEVDRNLSILEQGKVDELAKRLENAISNLQFKDADYTALRETVAQIPDENTLLMCTYDSVKKIKDILAGIDWGLNINSQDEVDAWALALDNAINSLVYLDADYTQLDDLLKQVPDDLTNYDNTEHLQEVLGKVKRGLDIRNQETVDSWSTELKQALSEITVKEPQGDPDPKPAPTPEPGQKPQVPQNPETSEKPKNETVSSVDDMVSAPQATYTAAPKTDDIEIPAWIWASIVLSGAAIIISGKKRKTE